MSFYMNFGAVNEGQQADEYKRRKHEEKAAQDEQDRSKAMYRMLNKERALTYNDPIGSYKKVRDASKKYNSRRVEDCAKKLNSPDLPTDRDVADGINADNAIIRRAEKDLKSKGEGINHSNMRRPEWYKECGIFDECTFLEESSWDDVKKARNRLMSNHTSRMKQLNNVLKNANNKETENDNCKKLDQINKDLDDLLKD